MKKLYLIAAALFSFTLAQAQLTGLEVEEHYVHDATPLTTPTGDISLDGYTTYRVYATTAGTDDFVSAVFGDGSQVTSVQTSGGELFQSGFGGAVSTDVNCVFYGADQSLEYDSWITIGIESSCEDGTVTAIGGNDDDPNFVDTFEATGGFELSGTTGGLWFTLNDEFGIGTAGDDNKVLLAQFTTNGCVSGTLWIQCFIAGDGDNQDIQSFEFSTCGEILGCTDDTALNYNPAATLENGNCLYDCAIELDGEIMIENPTCADLSDGGFEISVTGSQQFTDWTIVGSDDPPLAVGNFNNYGNGTYTVQVVDAVCGNPDYGFDPITFEVTLFTEEFAIDGSVVQNVSCLGFEDAIVEGMYSGATAPVMFGLDPGMLTQTDDALFEGVDNGVTVIYGEDANGCTAESNEMVVTSPNGFQVTAVSSVGSTCSYTEDGNINCNWNGGTGPASEITYSIDGINFQSSDIFNVAAGDYTITAIDANGCEDTFEITVDGPDEISLDVTETQVSCFGGANGSVSFMAGGGNGGFMYSWNGNPADAVTEYTDLAAGDNTVVVTDEEDCEGTFTVTVTQPDEIAFEVVETAILCNGDTNGAVEITNVTGGVTTDGTYEYGIDGSNYDSSNIFTGLGAGDITPGVTDSNGCEVTMNYTLTEPDAIDVTVDAITIEDDGMCNGAIDITVTGGTEPYDYTWTGPSSTTTADGDIADGCDGDYFLNIEDANGCIFDYGTAITITVGVEELEGGVTMTVYPNPTNGNINMILEGLNGQDVSYTLTDVAGRIIDNVELNAANGLYTQVIDITGEADGTYLLNLVVGNSTKTVRLIKH